MDKISASLSMVNNQEYFEYLKKRSLTGRIYRDFFLYPRVSRLLKGRVLDVGCGIGDMVKYRPGCVGVDVNELNVDFCRRRGLEAYLMPFDQLPFDTASFDSLLLDNVLEHLSDPVPLLNEIKRVMRPDGFLVIAVPGLYGQICDSDHKVYYNEASLTELAGKQGFTIEKFLYTPLFRSTLLSQTLKQYCIYSRWLLKAQD